MCKNQEKSWTQQAEENKFHNKILSPIGSYKLESTRHNKVKFLNLSQRTSDSSQEDQEVRMTIMCKKCEKSLILEDSHLAYWKIGDAYPIMCRGNYSDLQYEQLRFSGETTDFEE